MRHVTSSERRYDLLVRILVYNELLSPYGEHWVYDTPLFRLCLEATRNTGLDEYDSSDRRVANWHATEESHKYVARPSAILSTFVKI